MVAILRSLSLLILLLASFELSTAVPTAMTDFQKKEHKCLTEALFHEIRGGSDRGIRMVASVIYNRRLSPLFPGKTYCEIINQYKQFSYVQGKAKGFDFLHERSLKGLTTEIKPSRLKPSDALSWYRINKIAKEMLDNDFEPVLESEVLFYHATFVKPKWAKKMKSVAIKDGHVFLKMKGDSNAVAVLNPK